MAVDEKVFPHPPQLRLALVLWRIQRLFLVVHSPFERLEWGEGRIVCPYPIAGSLDEGCSVFFMFVISEIPIFPLAIKRNH